MAIRHLPAYVPNSMDVHTQEAAFSPANRPMDDIIDDLETDLALAARCDSCVLLTGGPAQALDAAREIAGQGQPQHATVDVIDCDVLAGPALTAALCGRILGTDPGPGGILLIREVHALDPHHQTLLANLLDLREAEENTPKLIASTSIDLHARVAAGQFDERLYYRLNTIHVSVQDRPS